jgi:hypothetical protein
MGTFICCVAQESSEDAPSIEADRVLVDAPLKIPATRSPADSERSFATTLLL